MIIGVLLSAEQLSQRHFSLVLEPDDSPIFWEGLNGFPPNINILDWGKWRRLVVVGGFILDLWTGLFVLPSLNARTFGSILVSCLNWEGPIRNTCCHTKGMLSFVRNNSRNVWARCCGKELVVYSVVVGRPHRGSTDSSWRRCHICQRICRLQPPVAYPYWLTLSLCSWRRFVRTFPPLLISKRCHLCGSGPRWLWRKPRKFDSFSHLVEPLLSLLCFSFREVPLAHSTILRSQPTLTHSRIPFETQTTNFC